ncbi:MAG: amidohydrolase [Bacteroidetes bacterium]|nr:MAG: amidohydrolase [Bacteroidota bacterium]
MKKEIQQLARQFLADVTSYRRHLHMYPELSFQEKQTGNFITGLLSEWGVEHTTGWAGHGVVALVRGQQPGEQVAALRADMDALPILEANEVPYKSKHDGIMHACGHDVHSAALLGAVRILHSLRAHFSGTVKCIFQPGEERLPGGASIMIREGVLDHPKPASIFAQHVHPPLEAGKVGFRPGMYMASADEIYVTVTGKGGHGAMPHQCIDPVAISAQMIVSLQQLISRYSDPAIPSVLTFGKIWSEGGATNVIPNEVKLEGTFRTMNETWRMEAHQRMKEIAEALAQSMGGTCTFDIHKGYPVLVNDEALTQRARTRAEEYLGTENVVELPIRLTAEDFAYFSGELPACFYRLGTGNPNKGITASVHTNRFDIDESALETGMGLMAWLAIQELEAAY